jgi:calcium/calmodulin-dependent protein kinase I
VVKLAARRSDGQQFAVKVIKRNKLNPEELALVHEEAEIMRKIEHENCAKFHELFESSKKIYMVMELLTGGELFDRIVAKGSYSEKEASDLVRKISSAIEYLHSIGIVHRDLKPENLIYQSQKPDSPIKITDFGLAKYRSDGGKTAMTTACGTPGYVAPEVLKNEPYGKEVDMWSLGVILYILLCGFPPFYHENTQQLYKQIKKGEYDFPDPYWTDISDSAKSLVRGLLTVDPKKRMTGKQVLAHPWITGENVSTKSFGQSHTQRLKLMQARRILRRTVRSVMAVNKFARQLRAVADGTVSIPAKAKRGAAATDEKKDEKAAT